jgi:hypothetical protein
MPYGDAVISSNEEFEVREAPELVRFKTGDCLHGVLIGRQTAMIQGKPALKYTLRRLTGEASTKKPTLTDSYVQFWGTADLISKLRVGDVGKRLFLHCDGEDVTVKRGDQAMKLFTVILWRKQFAEGEQIIAHLPSNDNGADPIITDDDIPF